MGRPYAEQTESQKAGHKQRCKKYEKTKKGFLMRLYRNMQSRVEGIQKEKFHLYRGKELSIGRDQFYVWALNSEKFHQLFEAWEESEYDRKLTPSVDRLDSEKGYMFGNIEWVTHSENSRRGSYARHRSEREAKSRKEADGAAGVWAQTVGAEG